MNKTQFLCATGALSTLFCAEAQAYVDPGSGAAIITAVLGAIGAIGYTFRKYYYKIKNGFQKRNGNKPRLRLIIVFALTALSIGLPRLPAFIILQTAI